MMTPTFSVVVPVFQNEQDLEQTLPRLLALRTQLPRYRLELVFVDDGSRDRSLEILTRCLRQHPAAIRIVKLTRNFGQTAATQAGLQHASGACVGVISADLQEPCELFVDMVKEWEAGAKFVIGERRSREEGWWHRTLSGLYWLAARRLAFPDFPRLGYDFCLLDRQVVDAVNQINEKNSSIFLLIYWLGFKPVRLPVERRLRKLGRSQWTFWKKVAITADTLIGFTYVPSRFITVMGFLAAVSCLLYLLGALGMRYYYGVTPPGWMTVIGLLTLLGSMVLFSLGIVSEYLLRVLDEARKRPPYVVDEVIDRSRDAAREAVPRN